MVTSMVTLIFHWIPLRTRLHELNLNKPIYVTCQIGLRGYIASRILSQNGFDTYNLNGGYRLYNTIFNQEHDEPKSRQCILLVP